MTTNEDQQPKQSISPKEKRTSVERPGELVDKSKHISSDTTASSELDGKTDPALQAIRNKNVTEKPGRGKVLSAGDQDQLHQNIQEEPDGAKTQIASPSQRKLARQALEQELLPKTPRPRSFNQKDTSVDQPETDTNGKPENVHQQIPDLSTDHAKRTEQSEQTESDLALADKKTTGLTINKQGDEQTEEKERVAEQGIRDDRTSLAIPETPVPTDRVRSSLIPQRPLHSSPGQTIATHKKKFAAHNLVSTTRDTVRQWTGKVKAVSSKMVAFTGSSTVSSADRYRLPPTATPVPGTIQDPLMNARNEKVALVSVNSGTVGRPVHPNERQWKRSRALRTTMIIRHRRLRFQRAHPPSRRIWYILVIIVALLGIIGSASGTTYAYTYYQNQLPHLQLLAHQQIPQTTRIYDRNYSLLYDAYDNRKVGGGRSTPVVYDDIPEVMRDAMVAAEDKTFWENSGIDPQGILRASFSFLQHNSVQGGGSTITQQVVKNMTHETQTSLNRKIPEAALAIGMTQQYSKQKILEMYFNIAPFGPEDVGVESAVEELFNLKAKCDQTNGFKCIPGIKQINLNQETGKDDPLLGLARATLLAGLPQNPVGYFPAGGDQYRLAALERQDYVLNQMIDIHKKVPGLGYVTSTIKKQVEDLTAKMTFTRYSRTKTAPHFVDWIIRQVETALGNGNAAAGVQTFLNGGFNIRTSIDAKLENYVETIVKKKITEPVYHLFDNSIPLTDAHNLHDGAVVVINPHTGEILAMNGSVDYTSTDPRSGGEYNAADPPANSDGTPPGRQPGSTFKPFVYATAFQMGWDGNTTVPDVRTYFPNGMPAGTPVTDERIYHPPDYSKDGDPNKYGGNKDSNVRLALAESQNVGAVRAMQFAGPENVLRTVKRVGITTIDNPPGISWALGTQNVTLLQLTGAYQTFANSGAHIAPQGILDIWDNYGHNLYHYDTVKPVAAQVFSSQISNMMTSILIDEKSRFNEFGYDHDLSFADIDPTCATDYNKCSRQVATKTGTTDGPKDTLTVGYTPNVVVGVWTGNANNESMSPGTLGIVGAAPIWHTIIETLAGTCPNPTYQDMPCPNNYDANQFAQELGIGQQPTFNLG